MNSTQRRIEDYFAATNDRTAKKRKGVDTKQPPTKRICTFLATPELDFGTLSNLSSALDGPVRAPAISLQVIDTMLKVATNRLRERVEGLKINQHTSLAKWLVDVEVSRGLSNNDWLELPSLVMEQLNIPKIDLEYIRSSCIGNESDVCRATLDIMYNVHNRAVVLYGGVGCYFDKDPAKGESWAQIKAYQAEIAADYGYLWDS